MVAGIVMDQYGARVMFQGIGTIVGALLYIHLTILAFYGKCHDKFIAELQAERKLKAKTEGLHVEEAPAV